MIYACLRIQHFSDSECSFNGMEQFFHVLSSLHKCALICHIYIFVCVKIKMITAQSFIYIALITVIIATSESLGQRRIII